MPVLHKLYSGDAKNDAEAEDITLIFYCPGCKSHHPYRIKGREPKWTWNGSMDKPTFTPSLMVNGTRPESRCHVFVTNGEIQFLPDCFHELKGTTIPLPECDW
jgi:hypothetical protein